jgi:hypothetical protein
MEITFAILTILSLAAWIFFKHSFFAVPLVVFLSLWVQDFFPLSHFPMYSDPDESEDYFYLATVDEEGEITPLPVRSLANITAPKVKKMFKSWAEDDARAIGKSRKELSDEQRAEVGERLLLFLKDQAEKRGRGDDFPDDAALVQTWIVYDNETGISETPAVVARLKAEDSSQ